VDRFYKALAEGGQPQQPPAETFFSKRFGMLNDKFGVNWILLVPQEMNENVNRKSGQLTSA
jgi:PhnB protein